MANKMWHMKGHTELVTQKSRVKCLNHIMLVIEASVSK